MNGIRVGDGLAMRRPLFESLEEHEWEEVLRKLNKFYTNKENKSEMDKVCLQFAVHRILAEQGDKEELEPMSPVLTSLAIQGVDASLTRDKLSEAATFLMSLFPGFPSLYTPLEAALGQIGRAHV